MRKIIVFLVGVLLSYNSNAQNSKAVLSFGWIVHGGNHIYSMRVTSKLKNIDAAFGKNESNLDPSPWKRDYLISDNAVKYILSYVKNHCDKTEYRRDGNESYFVISFFFKGKLTICDIKDKNASTLYYKGLKQWIEKSAYKKECRKIIRAIQVTYLDGHSFPTADFTEKRIR